MIASPALATAEPLSEAPSPHPSVPLSLRPSVPFPDTSSWSPRDSTLLTAFLSSASHSLPQTAARAEVSLDELLDWLDQPRVLSRIARIEAATSLRARIIAAESRILAIDALRTAASVHLHTFNTEDPARIARLAETARKSANQLLRIAGTTTANHGRKHKPDPHSRPERGASRPPTRPSVPEEAPSPSPQPEGLHVGSRGWSESASDTPGSSRPTPAPRRRATSPNDARAPEPGLSHAPSDRTAPRKQAADHHSSDVAPFAHAPSDHRGPAAPVQPNPDGQGGGHDAHTPEPDPPQRHSRVQTPSTRESSCPIRATG